MRQLRVLIADDRTDMRRVVREYLKNLPTISIVGEACDGIEAVHKVGQLRPDMVLVGLGKGNGNMDAARVIKQYWPTTRVVVAGENEAHLSTARGAQVDSFVLSESLRPSLEQLLRTFERSSPTGINGETDANALSKTD